MVRGFDDDSFLEGATSGYAGGEEGEEERAEVCLR